MLYGLYIDQMKCLIYISMLKSTILLYDQNMINKYDEKTKLRLYGDLGIENETWS